MKRLIPGGTILFVLSMMVPAVLGQAKVAAPALNTVEQVANGVAKLTWTFDKAQEKQIRGFVVERATPDGVESGVVSQVLPADARTFTDEKAPLEGVYMYRITAVGPEEGAGLASSEIKFLQFIPKPPVPTGLKAQYVKQNGKRHVRLTWDKKAAGDAITLSYAVYTDEVTAGKTAWISALPEITENNYALEMHNLDEKTYTLGIAAIGKEGQHGPVAEVKLIVPGSDLPTVKQVAVRHAQPADTLTVTWVYPELSNLKGFRLFANDEQLADEKTLGPKDRSWKYTAGPREKAPYTLSVKAVTTDGEVSGQGFVLRISP